MAVQFFFAYILCIVKYFNDLFYPYRTIKLSDSSNDGGETSKTFKKRTDSSDDDEFHRFFAKEFDFIHTDDFLNSNPSTQTPEDSGEEFQRISNNGEFAKHIDNFLKMHQKLKVKQSPGEIKKKTLLKRSLNAEKVSTDINSTKGPIQKQQTKHVRIISDELLENNGKFKIKRNRRRFHFEQFNHLEYTFEQFIEKSFEEILDSIKSSVDSQKKYEIGITIRTFDDLNHGSYDAGLTLRPLEAIEPQMLSELLSKISQSNQAFEITGMLEVETLLIEMPSGGTRIDIRTLSEAEILKHKTDIVDYPESRNNLVFNKGYMDWTCLLYQ